MLFAPKERGQGLVEYALILVLVAIVVIAALMVLGPIIGNTFSTVNGSLVAAGAGWSQLNGLPGVGTLFNEQVPIFFINYPLVFCPSLNIAPLYMDWAFPPLQLHQCQWRCPIYGWLLLTPSIYADFKIRFFWLMSGFGLSRERIWSGKKLIGWMRDVSPVGVRYTSRLFKFVILT